MAVVVKTTGPGTLPGGSNPSPSATVHSRAQVARVNEKRPVSAREVQFRNPRETEPLVQALCRLHRRLRPQHQTAGAPAAGNTDRALHERPADWARTFAARKAVAARSGSVNPPPPNVCQSSASTSRSHVPVAPSAITENSRMRTGSQANGL
jgi:hypothetical protein